MQLFIFPLVVDSRWSLIYRNSHYDALVDLHDYGPYLLPGSNTPVEQQYTGIVMLGYWLSVLQFVLANVADGSVPRLSLYSIQFAGQLILVLTMIMAEGMGRGNDSSFMSSYVRSTLGHLPISF